LLSTWWLWAYWPVRKLAREGQQRGKLVTAFWNRVPCRPIARAVNGIARIVPIAWSSVMTTTTFGLGSAALGA
jgi:hypothetical protein